jgi:hypothetical protein
VDGGLISISQGFEVGSTQGSGKLQNLATGTINARDLTVQASGTVSNAGSITLARDLTVLAAGIVSNSGSIALSRDAKFTSGKYEWQLAALSTSNPGDDFGMLTVGGNLSLGNASKLLLDFSALGADGPNGTNAFWDTDHSWKIIDTATNTSGKNFTPPLAAVFAGGYFKTTVGTGDDLGDIFLNYFAATFHPGDFDADGDVDGADFVVWQTNFPLASGAILGQGDADNDGDVDGADFVVWQTNFPFNPGPGASPVPEPAGLLLGALSAIGLFALRRRK